MGTGTPAWSEHDLLWVNAGLDTGRRRGLEEAGGELRAELAAMRLMALHKRAIGEGVSPADVEDAMDSDNPKAVLVELLLARQRDEAELPDEQRKKVLGAVSGSRGWRGFLKQVLDDGEKTHGHGCSFGDVDGNWHTDLLTNPGGFALCDTLVAKQWGRTYQCEERGESGVCDSREMPVVFLRSGADGDTAKKAAIRLQGTVSNRDAVGAHVEVTAADRTTHFWVHSVNGFQSQNSAWVIVPLGSSDTAQVRITWPLGAVSTSNIKAWRRTLLTEPDKQQVPAVRGLRPRNVEGHVADAVLEEENRGLKKRLRKRRAENEQLRDDL